MIYVVIFFSLQLCPLFLFYKRYNRFIFRPRPYLSLATAICIYLPLVFVCNLPVLVALIKHRCPWSFEAYCSPVNQTHFIVVLFFTDSNCVRYSHFPYTSRFLTTSCYGFFLASAHRIWVQTLMVYLLLKGFIKAKGTETNHLRQFSFLMLQIVLSQNAQTAFLICLYSICSI